MNEMLDLQGLLRSGIGQNRANEVEPQLTTLTESTQPKQKDDNDQNDN
jgi:hypothetical protein